MNKDYIFHVNWEDRKKIPHRVGILAEIDEMFYFILRNEKTAESAYKNGFVGIPGFKAEEVYRSRELFDFFKSRILENNQINLCEELAKTRGISMIDSFSVETVPEKVAGKYRKIILEAHELQENKKRLHQQKDIGQNKEEVTDSNGSHEEID